LIVVVPVSIVITMAVMILAMSAAMAAFPSEVLKRVFQEIHCLTLLSAFWTDCLKEP
jgi:hypothetical protein